MGGQGGDHSQASTQGARGTTALRVPGPLRGPGSQGEGAQLRQEGRAERFANSVETDKARGEYLDPKLGRVSVAEFFEEWFETTNGLRPKTSEGYESLFRCHIEPRIGNKPLASVRQTHVKGVISEMIEQGLSRSRVRQVRHLLGMLFTAAVGDGAIGRSPVPKMKLPPDPEGEITPLTAEQVNALADNVPARDRALVYLLAYGGLRWGEAAALRRGRVNLLRRQVQVREAASETNSGLPYVLPKTKQVRDVSVPRWLADMLAEHFAAYVASDGDALVFTAPRGGPLRYNSWLNGLCTFSGGRQSSSPFWCERALRLQGEFPCAWKP
jgi:integrase